MPKEGVQLTPDSEVLTTPEILRLATVFASRGVKKIRLTGGEPTLRRDIVDVVGKLARAYRCIEEIGVDNCDNDAKINYPSSHFVTRSCRAVVTLNITRSLLHSGTLGNRRHRDSCHDDEWHYPAQESRPAAGGRSVCAEHQFGYSIRAQVPDHQPQARSVYPSLPTHSPSLLTQS